ncbi:HxlR family transcriptional regulator [Stackebrandtia albiflava]|uniref:HxlR family transcriptional regulator n=1 Tax=Stackebrandtia albiflava TaxID=406432 RepID=A0A562UYE6_9ACTN|nr:helix-turn-helix domain-containing protein [Stackebrandtia albiflava]TWJ10632.1 HxlR family transcriptional regulator [Stackebrandtia albiflava]
MSGTHTGVPSQATPHADRITGDVYHSAPVTGLLRRLGERWTPAVLCLLARRARRFNALHREIDGISQRMLTRTLRGLEEDGLVVRTVFPTVPPSVEYSLSGHGRSLLPALSALMQRPDARRAETHTP